MPAAGGARGHFKENAAAGLRAARPIGSLCDVSNSRSWCPAVDRGFQGRRQSPPPGDRLPREWPMGHGIVKAASPTEARLVFAVITQRQGWVARRHVNHRAASSSDTIGSRNLNYFNVVHSILGYTLANCLPTRWQARLCPQDRRSAIHGKGPDQLPSPPVPSPDQLVTRAIRPRPTTTGRRTPRSGWTRPPSMPAPSVTRAPRP